MSYVGEFRSTFVTISHEVESIKARKAIYRPLLDAIFTLPNENFDADEFEDLLGVDVVLDELMEKMDLVTLEDDEYYAEDVY